MMKALVYNGTPTPSIEERAIPQIAKPTDAIVKMSKGSICGTDLHILKGDVPTVTKGRILGHEGVGVVESVGPAVKSFKVGDRVIISAITSCSACSYCRRGMPSHCTDGGWVLGNTVDGTQAEYVCVPHADASMHPMVKGASDADQVMLSDVLPTSLECGVLNGRVQPGATVAIVGSGPVGLGAVITSQLYSPSKLIVIDLDANRLKQAASLGATHTVVSGPDAVQQVMEITGGLGVDTVIEAVGVPATFKLCQDVVAVGGTIANLGVHGAKVDLHLEKLWDRNITITTRLVDAVSTGMLLKLVESGRIRAGTLGTHSFKFADIVNAYSTFSAAAKNNALKVILEF
ncbi:alcohol dehydrogenase GroES domain-containing protein [Hymenopellis radicata]|nr:alcohol dehydrogenase GroES domain-containing protein [Hymenopellis radicata]